MTGRRDVAERLLAAVIAGAALGVVSEAGAADATTPGYLQQLERAYGPPSQQGFGSAVFHQTLARDDALDAAALAAYRQFLGPLWDRFGESVWMAQWREVYRRPAVAKHDVVAELGRIDDVDARNSVPMVLEVVEDAPAARAALAVAFDDPDVTELRVFNLGDGEAMSGLLVAGRRAATGDAVMLVFLMD
jgi:hypothetical protein